MKRPSRDEEARSTDRPPPPEEETAQEIARAIRAAKSGSPGRYGPPAATAKIQPFDLAQALALSSADGDAPPGSSKPPREDDAPFVPGEIEVVGEEEVASSGAQSGTTDATAPATRSTAPTSASGAAAAAAASGIVPAGTAINTEATFPVMPSSAITKPAAEPLPAPAFDEPAPIIPMRQSRTGLVLLGLVIGAIVIAYAYITANR